jgi:hypothetical protein
MLGMVVFAGCSDSTSSDPNNGRLGVSVYVKEEAAATAALASPLAAAIAPPVDCTALGIGVMTVVVKDTGDTIRGSGDFACADHQGTVSAPQGSGYRVTVQGKPYQGGPVLWNGEVTGITVSANSEASVGIDRTFQQVAYRYPSCAALPAACSVTIGIGESQSVVDVLAPALLGLASLGAAINPASIAFFSGNPGQVLVERSGRITGVSPTGGTPVTITAQYPAGQTTSNNAVSVTVLNSGASSPPFVLAPAEPGNSSTGTALTITQLPNGSAGTFTLVARQGAAQPSITLQHNCQSIKGLTCEFVNTSGATITQITAGSNARFGLKVTAAGSSPTGTQPIKVTGTSTNPAYSATLNLAVNIFSKAVGGSLTAGGGTPFITKLDPIDPRTNKPEQVINQPVVITGGGFGAAKGTSTVTISGVPVSTIQSWSDTQINALVPPGAGTGDVVVTVEGTASEPKTLIVPWEQQNPNNVSLGGMGSLQSNVAPRLVGDGASGAIIVWQHLADHFGTIKAQHVNSAGIEKWQVGGVGVGSDDDLVPSIRITSDGTGGAIIAWSESQNPLARLGVHRLNGSGERLWDTNVDAENVRVNELELIPDGAGGAIMVWTKNTDIYAQRLNSLGVAQWPNGSPSSPVAITTAANDQLHPQLIGDGTGGAIIVWEDHRNSTEIYAQRIDSSGQRRWPSIGSLEGVRVSSGVNPKISGDGIIIWNTATFGLSLRAQRLNTDGGKVWKNDVAIADSLCNKGWSSTGDGVNGAIVVHCTLDDSTGFTFDGPPRVVRLTNEGTLVGIGSSSQGVPPQLTPDGVGGVILVGGGVQAQHVGTPSWTFTTAGTGTNPQVTGDETGGAIIVWERNSQIYAQGITATGKQ